MSEKWYKLDNAAKIFPAISHNDSSNYFRLSAVLKEEVKPELLKEAVHTALTRFPMYSVRLKRGIFWYYFEHNDLQPLIRVESPQLFDTINTDEHNKFMFCIEYSKRRISLEMFHALSDGNGGIEFFKTIIFYYLQLDNKEVINDGSIMTTEYEQLSDEGQDSFVYNYNAKIKTISKEVKAYKIKGTKYQDNWVGVIHVMMDIKSLKEIVNKKQVTVTEYLGSVLLYEILQTYDDPKKRPITLFTPVNARKYFGSKSLRNFMLYIRTSLQMNQNKDYTFDDVLNITKKSFEENLTKDHLTSRLVSNVKIEKNFFIRILPLFIKKIALNLSYKSYGSDLNTISFSNLGIIKVPNDFYKYVDNMYFMIGANSDGPTNLSASTYNDKITVTFTSRIFERTLQKNFVRHLVNDGLQITVQSNDLEVDS